MIVSDDHGTDLAVRGLPDTANFLVFPQDFVLKRSESGETDYLESAYSEIVEAYEEIQSEWDEPDPD